jgi:peptide-methionine (S)-S-oxide reductase
MTTIGCAARWTLLLTLAVIALATAWPVVGAQEKAVVIPAPATDESASQKTSEVAVLAGGCFWGVQGVYQHLKGVTNAVSGYAGGQKNTAQYEVVSSGGTGHAEAVQITFDPRQVSYARLLQVFFSVVHDPTQLNRQGPDVGTQYRSAIFVHDEKQREAAKKAIERAQEKWPRPITTEIVDHTQFWAAEDYHQDYLQRKPHGYTCHYLRW